MSDSDDTDLLLLIPPDFFAVDSSDSEDLCYARRNADYKHFHFDKLVTQVNDLEERVNFIESKETVTSDSISEGNRLNHSFDYSLSFDSTNCHNIYSRDLALRFYSLTSTGFSFNDNENALKHHTEVPTRNVIMPYSYQTASNLMLEGNINEAASVSVQEVKNPILDLPYVSCHTTKRSIGAVDHMSDSDDRTKARKESDFTHQLLLNTPHHDLSFLNEIDEYLEGKCKENSEKHLFPSYVTCVGTQDCDKGESLTETCKTLKSTSSSKMLSSVPSDEKVVELDPVDKLLAQMDTTHLDMKNKLQFSHYNSSSSGSMSRHNDQEGSGQYSRSIQQNPVNHDIDEINGSRKFNSDISDSTGGVVSSTDISDRSCKSSFLSKKPSDRNKFVKESSLVYSQMEESSKDKFYNLKRSTNDVPNKSGFSSENDFISSVGEYLDSGNILKPVMEGCKNDTNYCETLNSVNQKGISSQPRDQPFSAMKGLSKSNVREKETESNLKQLPSSNYGSDQSINRFPLRSLPPETAGVSSGHTNTDLTNGHVSLQAEGRSKTVKQNVPDDGYYSSVGAYSSTGNHLSLSDLWGRDTKLHNGVDGLTLEQKLQEEHYRRKHCENLIQELQSTILENQQKLAVALKVDQSKDYTIQQLQCAWKRLASHWQELEEQRNALSIQCSEEKEKYQTDMSEMMQKIKWYENEVSKALDVAHGYKEKTDVMEQKMKSQEKTFAEEKKVLENSVHDGQKHLANTERDLGNIRHEVKEIKTKLEIAEKNASNEKESATKAKDELKRLKITLEKLKGDLATVKEENTSLHLRLKEEKSRNSVGDQKIKNLQSLLDESRKKTKSLDDEVKEKTSLLEKAKSDLREYYQQQVELVVQEKLIEFQTQLDAAEASLHQEMEQREMLALETASKQIKLITEKNLLEVKLLEEKHKEELHLCKLQLTQAMQQIGQLQSQLQSYSNRKVEIVERLHSVMETQWQEALRIISGNSPLIQPHQEQHATVEKNVSDYNIPNRDIRNVNSNGDSNNIPLLSVAHSSDSSTTDEEPFNKDDQLTYRATSEVLTTKGLGSLENPDLIKKYVEVLLNRPPGNPLNQESSSHIDITETPVCEGRSLPKWEKIMENQRILQSSDNQNFPSSSEDIKCAPSFSKEIKLNKRPWK